MSCICCFFDNQHQQDLKYSCFNKKSFEEKLTSYKFKYISELKSLSYVSDCSCSHSALHSSNPAYIKFCNEVTNDFKTKLKLIEHIFDTLIKIYRTDETSKDEAFKILDSFLESFCTNYSSVNAIQMSNLLFRGREKGTYNDSDIHEYFHIPFNMKDKIGTQRFSASGTPMLYLAKSIPTAIQELNSNIDNLNFAVFFPIYSYVYGKGMYDLTNTIDQTLNEALISLFNYGSELEYENDRFTFSKKNANIMLADSILFQVLTFPVECKQKHNPEYTLPQLCTEYFKRKEYLGVIYQSTKPLNINEKQKYTQIDYNYCFFVPEIEGSKYNESLLNCFHTVCLGECSQHISLEQLFNLMDCCKTLLINQSKIYCMDEYCDVLAKIDLHIGYIKELKVNDELYFCSKEGHTEINLLYHFLLKIKNIIENPEQNSIATNEFYQKHMH